MFGSHHFGGNYRSTQSLPLDAMLCNGRFGAELPADLCESEPNWSLFVMVKCGSLTHRASMKFLNEFQKDEWKLTPKAMAVTILARRPMKDVPPVLAGIAVSQFYARGTFRQTNHWGNYNAIDWTVGGAFSGEHWDLRKQGCGSIARVPLKCGIC